MRWKERKDGDGYGRGHVIVCYGPIALTATFPYVVNMASAEGVYYFFPLPVYAAYLIVQLIV